MDGPHESKSVSHANDRTNETKRAKELKDSVRPSVRPPAFGVDVSRRAVRCDATPIRSIIARAKYLLHPSSQSSQNSYVLRIVWEISGTLRSVKIAKSASIREIALIDTDVWFRFQKQARASIREVSRIEAVYAIFTDRGFSILAKDGFEYGVGKKLEARNAIGVDSPVTL